jgi:hypothetical protein
VLPSESSASEFAVAFHEAGHAVAAVVLGIGYLLKSVRAVADEEGRGPGVDLSGDAVPRGCSAAQKPDEVSDQEWELLKNSPEKWKEWIDQDHETFAIYYLAGQAAQCQYSFGQVEQAHRTDYSHVERLVPNDRVPRLKEAADVLIAENWSDVKLVASELLQRGRLTGSEVRAILSRSGYLR